MKKTILSIATATLLATVSGVAFANTNFPNKPIKIVVPFAAGGTTDIVARIISEPLSRELGQPVIVENRGGGGGTIGAAEVARAPSDGYTLGISTLSSHATNPAINPAIVKYDPIKSFTFITNLAETPNVIAVHPSFPAKNFKEFDAEVKKNGQNYAYASSGAGGVQHLLMEYYKVLSGTQMSHIPYRGAGPALTDTVAGQVQMNLDNLPSSLPFIKTDKLVPIVVASPERLAILPDVPTFAEVGYPDVNKTAHYGLVGPANMPAAIRDKIYNATIKVLNQPDVKERIEGTGSFVIGNSPEDFKKQMEGDYAAYKSVVDKQNLKP